MRLSGQRKSSNVEDRRGQSPRMARRGVGIGCGGLIAIILFSILTGADPSQLLQVFSQAGGPAADVSVPPPGNVPGPPANDGMGEFASQVLASTEDTWNELLPQLGVDYREPTLVLFNDYVQSACGMSSAAMGPFYCPGDGKLYIDLSFFRELEQRFGAPGDFAQAYVISHEVAHHVQNLLGISSQVSRAQQQSSQAQANQLSVRLELQADCLAGVWGNHAARRNLLSPGDLQEGLRAASAIGDDAIQRQSTGRVRPESFTHGSSEQRVRWFRRGLETGDPNACETFDNSRL